MQHGLLHAQPLWRRRRPLPAPPPPTCCQPAHGVARQHHSLQYQSLHLLLPQPMDGRSSEEGVDRLRNAVGVGRVYASGGGVCIAAGRAGLVRCIHRAAASAGGRWQMRANTVSGDAARAASTKCTRLEENKHRSATQRAAPLNKNGQCVVIATQFRNHPLGSPSICET